MEQLTKSQVAECIKNVATYIKDKYNFDYRIYDMNASFNYNDIVEKHVFLKTISKEDDLAFRISIRMWISDSYGGLYSPKTPFSIEYGISKNSRNKFIKENTQNYLNLTENDIDNIIDEMNMFLKEIK